ncbi:hypothetical protein BDV59DRAFT_176436 [Aspergillus ambiguus]|uniref:uncharacterized protein n=1 Tax=Aspergillus ambiguus TaxID=176160 RepID=UPI003CCE4505
MPQLHQIFTLRAYFSRDTLHAGKPLENTPSRDITAFEGGFLRGVSGTRAEGFDASLLPGGGDWILYDKRNRLAHIDVRTQGRLSDGHGVYIQYTGYLGVDEDAIKFMTWAADAKTTRYGDHHWWTRPVIETSGMFCSTRFEATD